MELDLDDGLAADLAEEADERGFESPEAYARWVLTHRSAVFNPPRDRLLSHLDRLAGEVDRLRAVLESEQLPDGSGPAGQAWFDTSTDGQHVGEANEMAENPAQSAETGFEFGDSEASGEAQSGGVNEFAYSSDLEPPDTDQSSTGADEDAVTAGEATEEGADDDEIADAIADIDLADEEAPEDERETDA